MLASEYGWSNRDILDTVYLDQLLDLIPKINIRKTNDYKMQLAIIQNPHVEDPQKLWNILDLKDRYLKYEEERKNNPFGTFDDGAFERLKATISANSKIIVKNQADQ